MNPGSYIRFLFTRSSPEGDSTPRDFIPGQTDRYFRSAAPSAQGQVISDATAADLDLDAVFGAIDRTRSRVGQQYLYALMRLPQGEKQVAEFIRRTALFEADEALAARCTKQLQYLGSEDAYDVQDLIFDEPRPVKHIRLVYLLTAATVLSLVTALLVHPLLLLLFFALFFVNAYLHYSNKIRITMYLAAVVQLRKCIRAARAIAADPALKAEYDTSFLAETNILERRSRIIGVQAGDGNDFAAVLWLVIELLKIVFNEELILFHHFIGTVAQKRGAVHAMFRLIGETDAAISVARLKRERQTCLPRFVAQKRLEVRNIVHPLIPECRANSLCLDQQSLLLTGSNMSGKTTFIRTLCINALTGQTLGICFGESYTAPYLRIHSSVRIADDVEQGTSYYLAEVLTIKEFMEEAQGEAPCLFALDELFKGTNTAERIAAGKAVLARLNEGNHLVCVATHDTELTHLLDGKYALYHFREEVRDEKLAFDYQLHEGPPPPPATPSASWNCTATPSRWSKTPAAHADCSAPNNPYSLRRKRFVSQSLTGRSYKRRQA